MRSVSRARARVAVSKTRSVVAAFVCEYDSARCLLSDRGIQPAYRGRPAYGVLVQSLCHRLRGLHLRRSQTTLVQGKASPEFIAQAIASWERLPEKQINVTFLRNNLDMLARYNRRVIEQCYKRVYCSVKDGLVLSER